MPKGCKTPKRLQMPRPREELSRCKALGPSSSNPWYLKQWSVYSRDFLYKLRYYIHPPINLVFLSVSSLPASFQPSSMRLSIVFHPSPPLADPVYSYNYWCLCRKPPDPVLQSSGRLGQEKMWIHCEKRWRCSLAWPWTCPWMCP